MEGLTKKEDEETKSIDEELQSLSLSEESLLKHELLFGGAIRLAIPSKWRDVSDIRQVPDHQEVYQDCTFAGGIIPSSSPGTIEGTGGCLIVEILERQDDVKDAEAAKYFFTDLAEANGETVGEIFNPNVWNAGYSQSNNTRPTDEKDNLMPSLSARVKVCTCSGFHSVSPLKNRTSLEEGKAPLIRVELAVVRLKAVETDLLITMSMPTTTETMKTMSNETKKENERKEFSPLFQLVLKSLDIKDWSLFG